MSQEKAIEMFVGGLVLDPNTQAPVVVLKDESGEMHLPIWIGIAEATSIASAIKQVEIGRPLTHDLMYSVFGEFGTKIERVVITDLKESTYFAELILSQGDKVVIVDCRPSDAIALSLRAAAPIFVSERVLELARISIEEATKAGETAPQPEGGEDSAEEAEEEDETVSGKNFKDIDKDKWEEILADLDPDDFKYKM